MSKITDDGLAQYGTGCFIAVPIRQQWASKGQSIGAVLSLLLVTWQFQLIFCSILLKMDTDSLVARYQLYFSLPRLLGRVSYCPVQICCRNVL